MIAHRTHQYLPRWRPSGPPSSMVEPSSVASLSPATGGTPHSGRSSCDTPSGGRAAQPPMISRRTDAPTPYASGMREGFSGDFVSVDAAADASVHPLVRKAAAWSWRLLIILAALIALISVITRLELI